MRSDDKASLPGKEGNKLLAMVDEQCDQHKCFLRKHIFMDPKLGKGHRARLLQQVLLLTAQPAPMIVPANKPAQLLTVYTYEDELYTYLSQPKAELPQALHTSRVTEGITLPEYKDTAIDTSPLTGKTKINAPWRE